MRNQSRHRLVVLSRALTVAGLAAAVTTATLIDFTTDRWWVATMLAFLPRWIWLALPLAAGPGAIWGGARARLHVAATLAIVVLALMHPTLRLPRPTALSAEGGDLTVLSSNIASGAFDPDALSRLIASEEPDVVLLQECEARDAAHLFDASWHVNVKGGLCTAARHPFAADGVIRERVPPHGWGAYALFVPIIVQGRTLPTFNIHLETPRKGIEPMLDLDSDAFRQFDENTDERRTESRSASDWAASVPEAVVGGDFNMPVESAFYVEDWSSFENTFSAGGSGFGFTKRSRMSALRIDHILAGPAWQTVTAAVEGDIGSDHRPLIARLRAR